MPTTDELLSTAQACRVLEVEKTTLTRWVAANRLRAAHKMPGKNGAFLFTFAEIERLRVQREREAETAATQPA